MESIWSKTEKLPEHPALPGNMEVDAAVIGGGLAGVLTAYFLKRQGVEAVVLEADRLGSGQTQNTTAKITSQHGLIYDRLLRQFGGVRARQYADAQQEAVEEYERVTREEGIDCMLERLPAVLYTETSPEKLEQEYDAAARLGLPAELLQETELPFPVKRALRFTGQAQFHPLMFLRGILEKIEVYEKTRVQKVEDHAILTDRGVVSARHIVFASHYPFQNFPGFYFMRMHQKRSYVLALEGPPKLEAMYYGVDPGGLSFRSAGRLALLGGGGHRTGENREGGRYEMLWRKAREFWPSCRPAAAYSAQDCMTLDGVPYVGRFSRTKPYWYAASGFQKWGMTNSMAAAKLLSRQISGECRQKSSVFSPRRFVASAAVPTLVREAGKSAKGLLKEILYLPGKEFDRLPKGQGAVIRHCGKKRGAYRAEDGTVYLVSVRCPHLGCQLEWNPDEKSWDCPCHGSRFDYRGDLLDGPAQIGLKHRSQTQ